MKRGLRVLMAAGVSLASSAVALLTGGCQFDLDLPAGEDSDLTVDQLVSKMSKATDPQGRFKDAKSYILKQKIVDASKFERDEYSLEIKYKAPDFMKYTSFRGGKPFSILIFDGKRAWNVDPVTLRSTEVSAGTGMNLVKTFAALAKPGSTIKTVFKDVEVDMVRDSSDVLCYRLVCKVEDSHIAPYVILVGHSDYLTRSFETVLYGADDTTSKYVSSTGRYEWYDGIRMAADTSVEAGDRRSLSSIASFTLNPPISDDEFKLPTPFFEKDSKAQQEAAAAIEAQK